MSAIAYLFALLPFYLLGAFPSGKLVSKSFGVNLENQGSGNVGATNVARVVGKKAGIMTLALDVFKGFIGVVIANMIWGQASLNSLVAIVVVLGHCFSIPGKLKGGKGVATALGAIIALDWAIAIAAVVIFISIFFIGRIISLASISTALMVPIVALVIGREDTIAIALCVIGILIVFRHRENVERLIAGQEKRFEFKKA